MNKKNIVDRIKKEIEYRDVLSCMRCGLCLNHCPTFKTFRENEGNSPRGRLGLMRALMENLIEPTEEVKDYFNACVVCGKCVEVCPSKVKYVDLLTSVRNIFDEEK